MEERLLGTIYKDGDTIVDEGTESKEMYILQSGKVNVTMGGVDDETLLATLKEGDIFGMMGVIDKAPRSATVRAVGEARVLAIDHATFLRMVTRDPSLALRILHQMSQRVRNLDTELGITINNLKEVSEEFVWQRGRFKARAVA